MYSPAVLSQTPTRSYGLVMRRVEDEGGRVRRRRSVCVRVEGRVKI